MIENGGRKVAIEIDDEASHNPKLISQNKLYDDLLKQNSMIYLGWDVYRWAVRQMQQQPETVKEMCIRDSSLVLLVPLFPSAPALSVVKHVVKEPFLTSCGIGCRRLSRRALFIFRFGVLYLCRGRESRGFFESGVSIFNTPIQRIQPGERRT